LLAEQHGDRGFSAQSLQGVRQRFEDDGAGVTREVPGAIDEPPAATNVLTMKPVPPKFTNSWAVPTSRRRILNPEDQTFKVCY
jgi:hypothetical protein